MKRISFIVLSLILVSCFSNSDYQKEDLKLYIQLKNIEKIILQCCGNNVELNSQETIMLVDKINSAKEKGMIKSAKNSKLVIYLTNMDIVIIHTSGNLFKWNGSGDFAFEMDISEAYFRDKCSKLDLKVSNDSLQVQNPIKTIERIFNQYNEFEESTDSRDNLDSLKQSLKILEKGKLSKTDLTLIINVWMYYTVTDFPTRMYAENVLLNHRAKSIEAVKDRMNNKKEWETNDSAPFSELNYLLEQLEDDKVILIGPYEV